MIETLVTFITTRIMAIFVTTVVVVAGIPSLIVITHGDTVTIIVSAAASGARQHGDDETNRIIIEVKGAGDAVIAKLNSEEAACAAQISQLAAQSKLSAGATQAALDKGKGDFHKAVAPFLREVTDDEDEFSHLTTISVQTEQVFLARISEVQEIAVGDGGSQGVLVTVCQTILVQIQITITTVTVVTQPGRGGEGD